MTTEQLKPATNPEQAPYPLPAGPFQYPPPPGYAPFFSYPPPADGHHSDANGAPTPYPLIYPPPGVVYAFPPPPPQGHGPANTSPPSAPGARQKRKQVKMACTNCAAACKRCDEARPCERCQKYGIADSCVDGQRKERKKGIKRGPYKRKNKQPVESAYNDYHSQPDGEWVQGATPPTTSTPPAVHPVSFPPPPEGYYPIYYPPPPGTYTLPDGQPATDGNPTSGHPPPIVPFYVGGFPPYPFALPPGAIFQLPPSTSHPGPPPPPGVPTLMAEAGSTLTEKKVDQVPVQTQQTSVNPAHVSDAGMTEKNQGDEMVDVKPPGGQDDSVKI